MARNALAAERSEHSIENTTKKVLAAIEGRRIAASPESSQVGSTDKALGSAAGSTREPFQTTGRPRARLSLHATLLRRGVDPKCLDPETLQLLRGLFLEKATLERELGTARRKATRLNRSGRIGELAARIGSLIDHIVSERRNRMTQRFNRKEGRQLADRATRAKAARKAGRKRVWLKG